MARPDWRRHSPGWLLVAALHLGLWGLWQQALRTGAASPQPTRPEPAPVWLLWPAAPPATAAGRSIAPVKPPQPQVTAPRHPGATEGIQALPSGPATDSAIHAEAVARSEPMASSPVTAASAAPRGSLLDSEATRQALRDIARQPLRSERTASATGQTPHTAAQRMEQAVSKSAKSDCLRDPATSKIGPLPLGGLLALPGLAARALSGDCPR